MFAVSQDDVIAIRRVFMAGGRSHAIAELRRRFLLLNETTAPTVLERILAMPETDPPNFSGRSEPRRDGPESRRKKQRRAF